MCILWNIVSTVKSPWHEFSDEFLLCLSRVQEQKVPEFSTICPYSSACWRWFASAAVGWVWTLHADCSGSNDLAIKSVGAHTNPSAVSPGQDLVAPPQPHSHNHWVTNWLQLCCQWCNLGYSQLLCVVGQSMTLWQFITTFGFTFQSNVKKKRKKEILPVF